MEVMDFVGLIVAFQARFIAGMAPLPEERLVIMDLLMASILMIIMTAALLTVLSPVQHVEMKNLMEQKSVMEILKFGAELFVGKRISIAPVAVMMIVQRQIAERVEVLARCLRFVLGVHRRERIVP